MKELKMDSMEFRRILQNLHLENLTLHPALQKKVLDLVNSGVTITPKVIKDALNRGKYNDQENDKYLLDNNLLV